MSVEVRSPSATHDLGRLLGGRVPIGFGVGSQGDIWLLLKLADDELAESGQATPYRIV